MFLRAALIFLLLLTALHVANASTAQNGIVPSQFKEGYFSMGAETTYLSTSANYTDAGTSEDFLSEYGYGAFQSLIYGRYDFSDQTSIFTELPLNYATSENPTDNYSAFNASGITLGINFDLQSPMIKIIPQAKVYFAVEKFDRSSDEVLSSDGTTYFDVGSHFFKNISNLVLHGYLSYQYRLDGFSSLLNYQTDLAYKTQSFSLAFGVKGFESLTEDENSDNNGFRHLYLLNVNGGSLMYGSVDPARTDVFTLAKFAVGNSVDFYGSINKSLRGKNSGDYLSATIGFEYFFAPIGYESPKVKAVIEEKDNFDYQEEAIDPTIEEKIKTYNKPAKKIKPTKIKKAPAKKLKPRQKPSTTRSENFEDISTDNDLVLSKKQLGKKSTSTSPVKSKPKSKKPKRVNIDF